MLQQNAANGLEEKVLEIFKLAVKKSRLFEPARPLKYLTASGEFLDFRLMWEISAFLFAALIFLLLFLSRKKVSRDYPTSLLKIKHSPRPRKKSAKNLPNRPLRNQGCLSQHDH